MKVNNDTDKAVAQGGGVEDKEVTDWTGFGNFGGSVDFKLQKIYKTSWITVLTRQYYERRGKDRPL